MCDVNKSEETNMLNTTKMKQQATLSPPFLPAPPAPQTEFRFGSIETLIDSRQQHHHEHQQQQQNPSEGRGRILQQLPATGPNSGSSSRQQFSATDGRPPDTAVRLAPILVIDSAPSSPTSPSPSRTKRPCPLVVDALQRLDLLSPNYVPSSEFAGGKMPPVSPSYTTSDLGSSPRSSISTTHGQLGINSSNWTSFRKLSSDDTESECGERGKDFQRRIFSPTPLSPYSDCGIDCGTNSVTPYSNRSPNFSPLPIQPGMLHFNFDQIRSRSSMSSHGGKNEEARPNFDRDTRERSRSEGEMSGGKMRCDESTKELGTAEEMDTSVCHSADHWQTVPASSSSSAIGAGHKRRLLQKSRQDPALDDEPRTPLAPENYKPSFENARSFGVTSVSIESSSQQEGGRGKKLSGEELSRQPTIEEPPPSPTLVELFRTNDLDQERRRQVEEWIRQQSAALAAFRQSLVPPQQESNHLQVPNALTNQFLCQNTLSQFNKLGGQLGLSPSDQTASPGPIRSPTLWRRSRSESDVSASIASTASTATPVTTTSVALNATIHVCEHCGQGFSMNDRLAKHIASRHRDRSASVNDENNRIHKCTVCNKGFGRSDMLTRHLRLHSGLKPYSCHICGQVFSRSDHLSTHQRTHTGEKPYRCPQCSYSASRRDMITRHMRTHSQGDGDPSSCELQIPSIDELSLATPKSLSPQPPISIPSSSSKGGLLSTAESVCTSQSPMGEETGPSSPLPYPIPTTSLQSPTFLNYALDPAMLTQNLKTVEDQRALLSQLSSMLPSAQNLNSAITTLANNDFLAAATKLLSSNPLLNQQFAFSALTQNIGMGQNPQDLWRSTPNLNLLAASAETPSAFRPLSSSSSSTKDSTIAMAASAMQMLQQSCGNPFFPSISVTNSIQASSLTNNSSLAAPMVTTSGLSPLLFRQSSIGGLGFADNNHQQKPPPS